MFRTITIALALLQLPIAAVAGTCEPLRERIEATIRAAGVERFTVRIVDAAASAPGKVVGNCEAGTKKLVYLKGDARGGAAVRQEAPTAASAPAKARKPPPMITECKDGSQPADGVCR